MKKRVTVCMLAALVLAAGCGNSGQPSEPVSESSTENVQETETEEQPYQVEMVNYAKSDLVDINYPQITGWSNEEKQQEWNEIFEDAAIQMAGGMTGDTEESPLGENDSVSMTFTVEEQSDELLSLTCHAYYAYEGADIQIKRTLAHPFLSKDPQRKEVHFTVIDETGYRIETDIEKRTAECNFNNPTLSKGLVSFFDRIFNANESVSIDLNALFNGTK